MDPDRLDEIVAAIPSGSWMSYGDVARAAGGGDRHARALNQRFIRADRRRARTGCSRATGASAGPRWATRRRSAAGSSPRAWSSPAAAPTRRRGCARRGRRGSRLSARHNLPRAPATAAAARSVPRRRPGPVRGRGGDRAAVARGGGRRLRRRRGARRAAGRAPGRGRPGPRGLARARAARRGGRRGQEPGGAGAGAPRRRGPRGRGAGARRARARLAARTQRDDRGHGLEREDDDGRAARPPAPQRGGGRRGGRQRRHRADVAGRLRAARGDGRRAGGVVVPARGHAGLRARRRRPAQPRRGPPRPPRHVRRLQGRQARGVRAPAAGGRGRRARRPRRRHPGRRRARAVRARPGRAGHRSRRPRR